MGVLFFLIGDNLETYFQFWTLMQMIRRLAWGGESLL